MFLFLFGNHPSTKRLEIGRSCHLLTGFRGVEEAGSFCGIEIPSNKISSVHFIKPCIYLQPRAVSVTTHPVSTT